MSVVLSIRIPKKLKEEMDKLRGEINWAEEIRAYIEKRIRAYRKQKALEEISKEFEKLPESPKGLGARLVREDRDSH